MKNVFFGVVAAFFLLIVSFVSTNNDVFASEGTFELGNVVGEQARCFAVRSKRRLPGQY